MFRDKKSRILRKLLKINSNKISQKVTKNQKVSGITRKIITFEKNKTMILPKDQEITAQNNSFFKDIALIIESSRQAAYRSINTILVRTNWLIGKRIVEEEQQGQSRAEYGEALIENLSKYLAKTVGTGFSEASLRMYRRFYLAYPEFGTHCVSNLAESSLPAIYDSLEHLSWSVIRSILRIDDLEERNYYITEAAQQQWSVRTLDRNIKSGYYKRLLSTQAASNPPAVAGEIVEDFVKDPYVLEFLKIAEPLEGKESKLEQALIDNLQKFLLELGKGFSFVGRQLRISTETDHFYIDLVFYNYILKCFTLIDLKSSKLTHQDIGQMDMYVRMFDALKRAPDDNPTIGIILCADKSETMVKYSILSESRQIFASKYLTVLPSEEELAAEISKQLPHLPEE